MPPLTGLIPELATLAQSAEQTLRKRQVKGSNPLGGLIDVSRPQRFPVGAFAVSSASDVTQFGCANAITGHHVMRENPRGTTV
jgi:hypothetical protein